MLLQFIDPIFSITLIYFIMLNIAHSPSHIPKCKFSYATAQEYCELVKRSITKQRSKSRSNLSRYSSPSKNMVNSIEPQQKMLNREQLKLRIRLRGRSKTNSCQDSNEISTSVSKCQKTNLHPYTENLGKRPLLSIRRQISSYQQEHLLISLQQQNTALKQTIQGNEARIQKIKSSLLQQRKSQSIQREQYQQQIKKLQDTLKLQIASRSSTPSSSEDCSIGAVLSQQLQGKLN